MRSHCENCNEIFVFENSFCKYEENGSSRHVQPAYPKLQRLKSNLFWHLDFVFVLVFVFKDIPCFLSPLLILCLHVCFHLYPSLSPFITILNNFLHIYYVYIFNVFLSFFNGCCLMLFFRLVILFFFFFYLPPSLSPSLSTVATILASARAEKVSLVLLIGCLEIGMCLPDTNDFIRESDNLRGGLHQRHSSTKAI